jgi:hypothetical protein
MGDEHFTHKSHILNAFHKFCLVNITLIFIPTQSSHMHNEHSHTQNTALF